jgi:UDP-2,3-diacylglucosamine pyrophosphatase LpxH
MKYKACFISDLHLGCNKSQVDLVYRFLKENEFEKLYLVGDVIDIWRMKQSGFLGAEAGQKHINIIQRLLKIAKKGCIINYVYGNHDEFLSHFIDEHNTFGNIHFCEQVIHTTSSGKKYVVIHGHQFDLITRYSPWISKLGDHGYEFLIWLNGIYNRIRNLCGLEYWSLSKYVKCKVKKATIYISHFSDAVAKYASDQNCYGIICGHIHHAEMKFVNNRHYINCGCWTDLSNCNAIVENESGELQLINFGEQCIERASNGKAESR